jgi:hypothetical protein
MNDFTRDKRILRELHAGRASRNRNFFNFATPSGRRIFELYRMLRALRADLALPGCRAWVETVRGPGGEGRYAVVVNVAGLRYRRTARLSPWEADFFLHEMGAAHYLHPRSGGGA